MNGPFKFVGTFLSYLRGALLRKSFFYTKGSSLRGRFSGLRAKRGKAIHKNTFYEV